MDKESVLQLAVDFAAKGQAENGKDNLIKVTFNDGSSHNLDSYSSQKIVSCYSMLDDDNKGAFEYMLNSDATSFNKARDFAVNSGV